MTQEPSPDDETKILRQPNDLERTVLNAKLADMSGAGEHNFEEVRKKAEEIIEQYDVAGVMVLSYRELYEDLIRKKKGYITQEEADKLLGGN